MIDFKEYTKLRDIAQKRIKRAQAAGVPLSVHIPTVKELRARGSESADELTMMNLQQFLSTGFSLQRRKESRREYLTAEEKRQRRRDYEREYRRRKKAKEYERIKGRSKGEYQTYLKGLKTLGVDIPPSKLSSFFDYADYRFAQGKSSGKYIFDIFIDDYLTLLKKGYSPDQIVSDFQKFENDMLALKERETNMTGLNAEEAVALWDTYIDRSDMGNWWEKAANIHIDRPKKTRSKRKK